MTKYRLFIIFTIFLVSGCGHYNYGVEREFSPIPYKNLYEGDDLEKYEFHSTLFQFDVKKEYADYIELTHLNDVYNYHENTPEETWRSSVMSFNIRKNTGVKVLPETVKLQHFYTSGKLIQPNEVLSTLNKCKDTQGCNAHLTLRYNEELPEKIIEKVSFTLIVNGKEQHLKYMIPLEFKYHYSFWDVLMGV